jgi:hypothetical protein
MKPRWVNFSGADAMVRRTDEGDAWVGQQGKRLRDEAGMRQKAGHQMKKGLAEAKPFRIFW